MVTNMAEILKLAARPTPYDKDERTWLMVRVKLEKYLTLVNERYVQLLQDAESQPVANVPAGTDGEICAHPNVEPHTVRLVGDTDHRTKLETGTASTEPKRVRRLETENAPKTAGRRLAILQAVLQPGMGERLAKFEEAWNAREQVDVYEELATSKLDGDVKISGALREAPTKLRDNLLVNSQQFESYYRKFRAIVQAYLNTNKNWTASDFRNDTKESDPMEVENINKGKGKSSGKGKGRSNSKGKGKSKGYDSSKSKGKGTKLGNQDKECYVCGKKGHIARDCWTRANQDTTVN